MILAGDIGATKALLGLFTPDPPRPRPTDVRSFPTRGSHGFEEIVASFLSSSNVRERPTCAVFGVAGPVRDGRAALTNAPWEISARHLAEQLGTTNVALLNDLEAMAHAVPVLDRDELLSLQAGTRQANGAVAVIAAGTGLGGCTLHWVGGTPMTLASEVGHADFAARTDRELALVAFLRNRLGRVQNEAVVSGMGLEQLHAFTHRDANCSATHESGTQTNLAAIVTEGALRGSCLACAEAVDIFVEALGAVAGNIALHPVATGGVYLGGGIPPRLTRLLTDSRFTAAFTAKAPMEHLLEQIPLDVILNREAGLLGAATHGAHRYSKGTR